MFNLLFWKKSECCNLGALTPNSGEITVSAGNLIRKLKKVNPNAPVSLRLNWVNIPLTSCRISENNFEFTVDIAGQDGLRAADFKTLEKAAYFSKGYKAAEAGEFLINEGLGNI